MEQQEETKGGHIVSDQEIIDVIDAEIASAKAACEKLRSNSPGYTESLCGHIGFINGLKHARALIVKRMEGSK